MRKINTCSSGSTFAAPNEQNSSSASSSTCLQHSSSSSSNSKLHKQYAAASTNRQTCDLTCDPRHSLCKQCRHNDKIGPPSSSLSYLPENGSERRTSQERGGKGACACSSSSSACLRWFSCLQQHLLAAALACSGFVSALVPRRKTPETVRKPRFCTVYSYAACSGFISALVPREKASETKRSRAYVRFIHTVHHRETAVALVPRKKA